MSKPYLPSSPAFSDNRQTPDKAPARRRAAFAPAKAAPKTRKDSPEELYNRLRQFSPGLPGQVRRAAAYAAEHPRDIAFHTIREFSSGAGVSPASTLRMVRVLGFKGYRDFRNAFRKALRSAPHSPAATRGNLMARNALLSCFCSVPAGRMADFGDKLDAAAERILGARAIYVVGFRSAHLFASYFVYHAQMTMPNFHLASSAMSSATDHLASADRQDLVVFFSMEPYAVEAVQLAFFLANQNITTIAITDDAKSPLSERCNLVLETKRLRVGAIQSMAGCITVSEALLSRCFEKMGPEANRRIGEFEHRVRRMRGYWPPA